MRRPLCCLLVLVGCGDNGVSPSLDAAVVDAFRPIDAGMARCGNGQPDPGEVCDDGNNTDGDGCRGDCLGLEACGDGRVDVGEYCLPDLATALGPGLPGPAQGFWFGDVDRDGDEDLAIYQAGQLFLQANDGAGQLGEPVATGLDVFPGTFARLDQDAFEDLVGVSGGKLVVLAGQPGGGWARADELLPVAPSAFVVADVDDDGDLDVVAVVDHGEAVEGEGFVLANDGEGHFEVADDFAPGFQPISLVVDELDILRGLDIAVTNDRMEDNLHVFLADHGLYGEPDVHDLVSPGRMSAGRIDGDGALDLIVGGSLAPGVVSLLVNDALGGFDVDTLALPDGTVAPDLIAADLDGDRAVELIGRGSGPARRFVLRNDGAGSFSDFKQYSGQVVDLNGDGAADLVELEYLPELDETVLVGRLSDP